MYYADVMCLSIRMLNLILQLHRCLYLTGLMSVQYTQCMCVNVDVNASAGGDRNGETIANAICNLTKSLKNTFTGSL